ncbi:MATE family efflux transporter [Planomicrobium sp. CPCC 101079]|uniref:MATE family efflux transporter n=1 Tax=Planomicrobium sp. CPCC 101079 TaxID=2599618 RepID=UPI0011B4F553|nr:MATE family efflux transporter [Planomicrobium sp. CPCC 101079]TWT01951.1 MATE family efflux transporter [Planomicrobium sp. CPCC 101079]
MNHRAYLALAIPLAISTITTPLLGAVDTAVVGQLPNPAYIGGVAVGTVIFNTMYWLFGFLRVSTSGFAAQASGANDERQSVLALARPFFIALLVSLGFLLLQKPIEQAALALINPAADVSRFASEYFGIRIWGVPFTLLNYVILGWLMGMGRIKISVTIQILMNVLNIILALLFVNVFSWGISGVATATLIAEFFAFALGVFILWKEPSIRTNLPPLKEIIDSGSFKKMMSVNQDLFIRTLCLLTVFNLFTMKSASFGTEMLAANAVLFQIHYLMAYVYDGFSNASSIFAGKAKGANDRELYTKTLSLSSQWAVISSVLIAAVYFIFSERIISIFTNIPAVIALAGAYDQWLILFPIAASFGLVLYGLFTGATETAPIRNSMIFALLVFLLALYSLVPLLGNHGLWLAFLVFSFGRSFFLALYVPKLNKKYMEWARTVS